MKPLTLSISIFDQTTNVIAKQDFFNEIIKLIIIGDSLMNAYFAEFFGTALLILLGNGVVANVCLNKTKGQSSGWIVITTAWAFAVYVAVVVTGPYSGAHLNPAVTLGVAMKGAFAWELVPGYIAAQVVGGM